MQMYNLVEKPIILEDVPILASFTEEKINGVAGRPTAYGGVYSKCVAAAYSDSQL